MKRGEVYWLAFKAPRKRRPVVVLTRDTLVPRLNSVTVAEITSTVREIPSQVILTPDDGMSKTCAVNLHNIQTVQQSRFKRSDLITVLPARKMRQLAAALKFALEID